MRIKEGDKVKVNVRGCYCITNYGSIGKVINCYNATHAWVKFTHVTGSKRDQDTLVYCIDKEHLTVIKSNKDLFGETV